MYLTTTKRIQSETLVSKSSRRDVIATARSAVGLALFIVCGPTLCGGSDMEISRFSGDGEIAVTNVPAGTWVRVEWASSLTGNWHRAWQTLDDESSGTNSTMSFRVPRFYRVVSSSDPAPSGMVLVDTGPFRMGNADTNQQGEWWYAREVPVHTVDLSAFYMARYEVSNEQMRQVMQWAYDEGLLLADSGGVTNAVGDPQELLNLDDSAAEISFTTGSFTVDAGRESFPCVMLTWYGAMAYCSYRSQMEGLDDCIDLSDWSCDFNRCGYRLPTEAEWEKAARGKLVDNFFPWHSSGSGWSNYIDGAQANYDRNGDPYDNGSTPLGYFNGSQSPEGEDMANGYGLYDMAGNVYEWCWDRYAGSWYGQPGATVKDTSGPLSGSVRVLRGGAWYRTPEFLRCSFRHYNAPDFSYYAFGFRYARSVRP